ncbi:hypothetical protein IKQ21_04730, partial [bacterium]|nr:hypothetical protein [bacterium]
ILGLFQYLIFAFHLDFLNTFLFDIITNARFSLYTELAANMERLRIFSVFNEPGVLGKFIFLMMPLVFHLSYSKYKLLQNKSANFIIKKSFIPLMILVLIMTQSGFWVPICTAEFLFFIFRFNLINIRKNIFIFVPIIVFFLISIVYISVEYLLLQSFEDTSVVSRIFVVISHITSLDGLVKYEPSLAGRIITIIIQMKIFMKNIFFGIGFANVYCGAKTVIDSANIPVTLEILSSYYSMPGKMAGIGQSPIFTLLAETGIFGALFFIIFEITNIVSIYKISKKIEGLNKVFVTGLFECLICLFLLCFYTSYLDAIVFWLLFGLSLTVIYANKYNKFYIGEIKPIKYITNKNTSTEDNNE